MTSYKKSFEKTSSSKEEFVWKFFNALSITEAEEMLAKLKEKLKEAASDEDFEEDEADLVSEHLHELFFFVTKNALNF